MSRGIHGDLVLGKTPSGRRFKAYLYGQMIGHIQDWVGPNYRLKPLDKQPPNGFATIEEAFTHARTLFPTEADFERWAHRCGDGQFVGESRFKTLEMRDVDWKDGAWVLQEK